jgi:hypothetical protein
MNTSCVGQLPVTITNTQENQSIKTKGLIWLTGFGGSTAWSPLLWACGEVAHHGQISQGAKLLTSWSGSKNGEEEEGAEVLGRGSKVHPPPVTGRLPTRTHLLKFPHRSPAPGAGGQAFLCRCTHGGHRGCRLQWFPWGTPRMQTAVISLGDTEDADCSDFLGYVFVYSFMTSALHVWAPRVWDLPLHCPKHGQAHFRH